jgi:hypothetical protein
MWWSTRSIAADYNMPSERIKVISAARTKGTSRHCQNREVPYIPPGTAYWLVNKGMALFNPLDHPICFPTLCERLLRQAHG